MSPKITEKREKWEREREREKKRLATVFSFYSVDLTDFLWIIIYIFISLIRMRSKRDIKMGRLCTPGGAVLGIVGGGCDVTFFKWWGYSWRKYAILGAFIRSCGCLENPTRFQTIMVKIIWAFWKKSVAFGVPPAYSRYRRFRPRGENWLILC